MSKLGSKTIGTISGIAGVLVLLLSFFVTYVSFVPGIGVIILGAAAIVMGRDDGGETATMPIVGSPWERSLRIVATIAAIPVNDVPDLWRIAMVCKH